MSANSQVDILGNMRHRVSDLTRMRAAGLSVIRFEVVTEYADYLDCAKVESVDPTTQQPIPVDPGEGTEQLFKVWKPWFLRSTPFDGVTRDEITYAESTVNLRSATDAEDVVEWQTITPSYSLRIAETQAGELIHAIPCGDGEYQDINLAGRCWAETEEPV